MDRLPALGSLANLRPRVKSLPKFALPAGVLLLAAFLFFSRLGERAIWSEELRWVEIPREMLLNHDLFRPTINGHSYYDKPLGSYWLVLAASLFTGEVNELAARIPCSIAGLIAVGLLMAMARRLFDKTTAALAGLILATSFSFAFFARNATADMENLTGVLAALALLLWHEDRRGGWWTIGLWLIMAATSLTKGLPGFALPLLVFGVDSCISSLSAINLTRRGSPPPAPPDSGGAGGGEPRAIAQRFAWLLNRWSIVAIPLGMAAFLIPFAISGSQEGLSNGLELVYRENIKRFFQPHNHRGPIYLYGYVIFGLMAPWSVFLPAALLQAHHSCRVDALARRGDRFALAFFWGLFIFFTLAASRRSYYLLPILPAGAMLISRLLTAPRESICRGARWLLNAGFAALVAIVLAAAVAFLPPAWRPAGLGANLPAVPALPIVAALWLACIGVIGWALWQFSPRRAALAASIVAVAMLLYLNQIALPEVESLRDGKAFALRVKDRLAGDVEHLALFRTRDPVFYLAQPTPIREFLEPESLRQAVAAREVRWLIIRQEHLSALSMPAKVIEREAAVAWDDESRKGGKLVLVELAGW